MGKYGLHVQRWTVGKVWNKDAERTKVQVSKEMRLNRATIVE